ncbi:hypothetical protein [Riemerella anatipestifer]|uniref:hypothetical protein n=1 Tax=Riemerella anatipestifer TaxID=34085 RepID=UPI0021F89007|nr:hypothetical protein [Riemerella anatipestifer]MCW0510659.1 hypothetical protein [Riemerella anatipestifer]MCW0518442.1 hypothetical protein [Riemerella anatipestifer]MEE3723973.1 hypothetical protein [Riemerella anatipestifer]
MATRAYIFIKENDRYKGVYNHYDGYPEYLGETLKKHYNTFEKANALISLGSLKYVKENLEDTIILPPNDPPIYFNNKEEIEKHLSKWAYYIYIFENNKWYYKNTQEKSDFKILK